MKNIKFVIFLSIASIILFLNAQSSIQELKQKVNDFTNTLSFQEWQALDNQFKAYEDSVTVSISVLLISSLQGNNIDEYISETFEQNKIGQDKNNQGILLLIVKEDNKAKIFVGDKLQDIITNNIAESIIEKHVIPYIKSNNYFGGILTGVDAVINQIVITKEQQAKGKWSVLYTIILVIIAILILIFIFIPYSNLKKRKISDTITEKKP